ncbi:MAG: hypothetical protein QOH58_1035 [Thermoleophilaceae bacterium]|nr:hypothetical protein [Thermoleophilaceae bacterium]
MPGLEGARVLVTGGTSGIGAAVVAHLSARGARVALPDRDAQRGGAVAEGVAHAVDTLGGLDAVVLSAGVRHEARLSDTSDDAWDAALDSNLLEPYRYAVACLPWLRSAGGGSIVTVAAGSALWPEMELGAYSVAKRGLLALTRMLAVEAAPHGVRVNSVCPGDTAPDMADASGVAGAVAFFVSPFSASCSGAALLVDGGRRASQRGAQVAT